MNFKTTIVLIVLLAAAGLWLFFTREHPSGETSSATASNLVNLNAADVDQVTVTPADGDGFTLAKSGADWELTKPVKAPAETFEVDSLIRGFTDAKPTGSVAASDQATGLSQPRYTVELSTPAKTVKLLVGDRSAVGGDSLYVQVDGSSQAQMIPADVDDKLSKGPDPFRKMNLVSASADAIKQLSITTPQQKIVLQKQGSDWRMTQPVDEPVDESAASDLTFALTGLRADKFVDPKSIPAADIDRPQLTVAFSTQAPSTQPAATQPAWTTVAFGAPQDIRKQDYYVDLPDSQTVATVAATSLDSFRKTPLDLRDKKLVDFDPNVVKAVTIVTDVASTTRPAKPAVNTTVTLTKRPATAAAMGPALPTTRSTTRPATAPTNASAAPASKWLANGQTADDSRVTTLLSSLHPLRVDRYLASRPTTQPAARYTLTVTTTGPFGSNIVEHTIHLIDPGNDAALIGSYNDLTFELPRTLLTNLQGPWEKK